MVQVWAESSMFPGMSRLPGPTPALSKYLASQAQIAIFEQVTRNNSCMCKLKFCLKTTLCLGSLKGGRSTAADIEFHFNRVFAAAVVGIDPHSAFPHFSPHAKISCSSMGRTSHVCQCCEESAPLTEPGEVLHQTLRCLIFLKFK